MAFFGGDDRGDRRTFDPFEGSQTDGGGGDHAARVAGGDEGLGFAFLEEIDRTKKGAILFFAQTFDRFALHGEDVAGVQNMDSAVVKAVLLESVPDLRLITNEPQ